MKKTQLAILILGMLTIAGTANAQFTIGPKFGVSSSQIKIDHTETDGLTLNTGDKKIGLHVGAFSRITLGNVFIQPEVLWTSAGGEIDVTNNGVKRVLDYKLNKIDVPVMIGVKMGPLRLQAGPVANFLIEDEVEGIFDVELNDAVYGYQAGIGLDIANMIVDVKYEGNLSKLGDSIEGINIDQRNNQVIVSLGFKLF